ncbi:MAG: gliding motility-associated C-terminal domain-containing protein [Bacteroidota bacterium]
MKYLLPLGVLALLCSVFNAHAQTPTIQDCLGAIPICEPIYREDKVANGMGNYPDEISNAISCLADERNAIWYTFTVNKTGDFGFILTPNNPNDDYDWALYDITNADCADIRNNPNLLVSCNAAGQQGSDVTCIGPTGATGGSEYNIQGAGCHTNPPTIRNGRTPLNALIEVEKYNTYVLVVSNWSRSTNGYVIDFSASGGIGIFDLEDPVVLNASFPEQCGDNRIEIEFNENIQCATVNTFNFVLDGPGAPYDVQLSSICDQDAPYTRKFEVFVDPPITQSGQYTLSLDGDRSTEVLDLCGNPSLNTSFDFEVNIDGAIDIDLGEDIAICPGNGVTLDATLDAQISNFQASYLWSTGATTPTINVSAAGDYGVTVTLGCATGSDEISLIVDSEDSGPYVNLGPDRTLCTGERIELDATNFEAEYLWSTGSSSPIISVSQAGIYEVSVTDDCGTTVASVEIMYADPPMIDLGTDQAICPGESFTLDATSENATYLWQDGSTDPTFEVTQSGIYAVSVTTLCGTITDEMQVNYTPALQLDLGTDQQLCEGQNMTLNASNADATYLWQDGSSNATFEVTESGIYEVTVTNGCESISDQVEISFGSEINLDLGEDQALCEGERVLLDANNSDVVWQDGSTNPIFEVTEAGIYWAEISSDCGVARDSVIVTFTELPSVDLGADQQICGLQSVELSVSGDVEVVWQDGSTDKTFTVMESGTYSVNVSNSCGTVSDEIQIEFVGDVMLDLGADRGLCEGESIILNADNDNVIWQDGRTNPNFEVTAAGIYWAEVSSDCGLVRDSVIVTFTEQPAVNLGADQSLCAGENLVLEVVSDFDVLWQDGSQNSTFIINESGTYSVEVSNACGVASDEIRVQFVEDFELDLGADQQICEGENLLLESELENVNLLWQDGSTESTFSVKQSGIYWLRAENECFTYIDSVNVELLVPPSIDLGEDGLLCQGDFIELDGSANTDADYRWQDGTTNPIYEVAEAGLYVLTATNDCGTASSQVRFRTPAPIEVDLGPDSTICEGDSYPLLAGNSSEVEYRWQDGSDRNSFIARESGIYVVQVSNECETVIDEVFLQACQICDLYVPTAFSPNLDSRNDLFRAFPSCNLEEYQLQIYDRWGTLIYESNDLMQGWPGLINNRNAPPGVYVWKINYMLEENYEMKKGFEVGEVTLLR